MTAAPLTSHLLWAKYLKILLHCKKQRLWGILFNLYIFGSNNLFYPFHLKCFVIMHLYASNILYALNRACLWMYTEIIIALVRSGWEGKTAANLRKGQPRPSRSSEVPPYTLLDTWPERYNHGRCHQTNLKAKFHVFNTSDDFFGFEIIIGLGGGWEGNTAAIFWIGWPCARRRSVQLLDTWPER